MYSLDEIDASAASPLENRGSEEFTLSEEEMSTLHRFLGQAMQTLEAGFRTTASNLVRQLHELVMEHIDTLVCSWLTRSWVDPDHP